MAGALDDVAASALQHVAVCSAVYGTVYGVGYLGPSSKWLQPRKINSGYPGVGVLGTEFALLVSTCVIAAAYDVLIRRCVLEGADAAGLAESWWWLVPFLVFWGESHFYWTHRFLHAVPVLYKNVHKWHHLSPNPDPWSGLAFHPVEGAVYLSSMLVAFAIPGYWTPFLHDSFRWASLLFPLLTHHGFDDTFVARYHYLHHALTNCNYGGWPGWDWLCGTLASDEAGRKALVNARRAK
eukprot:TRINITY_DN39237_c0_g1_i1.p2 TRINITY_DN39237_c0_g1~~TRINITY_DN39237_c0_g1_i1.p2  ORF type:complete len:256 (+),score=69.95 TRINITY_DN39237_c0_g1_i1:56-769(+)